MGYRQEKITSKVSEFSTQQIISGLTGSDLVTQALLINHQGDEIASEGITPAYNTMLASNDFSTQFLGRTLISLTTDNAPADNNIILALTPLIPYVIKAEINLIIGQTQMSVNGVTNEIDLGRSTVSVVKNGRTLLPIRAIIEALGGTVDWDGATQKVTLTVDGRKIEMWINKPNMLVNGVEREIDPGRGTVPEILNERTMLPIRAIIEAFRGTVSWDENTKMVTITY